MVVAVEEELNGGLATQAASRTVLDGGKLAFVFFRLSDAEGSMLHRPWTVTVDALGWPSI